MVRHVKIKQFPQVDWNKWELPTEEFNETSVFECRFFFLSNVSSGYMPSEWTHLTVWRWTKVHSVSRQSGTAELTNEGNDDQSFPSGTWAPSLRAQSHKPTYFLFQFRFSFLLHVIFILCHSNVGYELELPSLNCQAFYQGCFFFLLELNKIQQSLHYFKYLYHINCLLCYLFIHNNH